MSRKRLTVNENRIMIIYFVVLVYEMKHGFMKLCVLYSVFVDKNEYEDVWI